MMLLMTMTIDPTEEYRVFACVRKGFRAGVPHISSSLSSSCFPVFVIKSSLIVEVGAVQPRKTECRANHNRGGQSLERQEVRNDPKREPERAPGENSSSSFVRAHIQVELWFQREKKHGLVEFSGRGVSFGHLSFGHREPKGAGGFKEFDRVGWVIPTVWHVDPRRSSAGGIGVCRAELLFIQYIQYIQDIGRRRGGKEE